MSIEQELEVFSEVIERNGRAIMKRAIDMVLGSKYDAGTVSLAAKYHTRFLQNVLPVFPALVSLSCEAAGGKKESTVGVGAALTLFVEASNIHDDIIDKTTCKHKRKTTFAKFGGDITLLAGDLVLVKAALSLAEECESLPHEQRFQIIDSTFRALNKISKSAAAEIDMRGKIDTTPQAYLEVLKLRASVPEVHCLIGGILGGGDKSTISSLTNFGRNYGVVGAVIDEFMDLYDYQKLCSRLKNECAPLPVLCALQNSVVREKIMPLQGIFKISRNDFQNTLNLIINSEEVQNLREDTATLLKDTNFSIDTEFVKRNAVRDISTLLTVLNKLLCNLSLFTNRLLE